MATMSPAPRARPTFFQSLALQCNVIGALLMRELHTRYGRENVGYLWVIGEPLTLASMIALIHAGQPTHYANDMAPVPFAVMGYCIFIMFRGLFNRAEGALEANAPLLYHKMVTVFDIMISRALLELVGTSLSLVVLTALLISIGLADWPPRPLWLMFGVFIMFWFSFNLSMIIVSITHDNRTLGRMVHPVSYIMMPLSGAFYRVEWIPETYRQYLEWFPLPQIFEMCRYGYFQSAKDTYFHVPYLIGCCLVLSYIGLVAMKIVRGKVHLH
ncbi:MAG: transporter [Sphingomonas bacterium]|jgi:capsular polysaccharide transport system permease protein|nr:ABC transporter permease [Sphingomonas bacterium]MDB5688137.1 transporter [Sphingomonas bacterium]